MHASLDGIELLVVDEHFQFAGSREIEHGREQRGAGDRMTIAGRIPGRARRQQRTAEAVADGVDLALAGRQFDGLQRRRDAVLEVIIETAGRIAGIRIDPGDHEHRLALFGQPFDERVLGQAGLRGRGFSLGRQGNHPLPTP